MASGPSAQLENVIDEVLKSRDVQALDVFLQRDIREETPMKCSQQFLTKLDKVISRSLDKKDPKSASLGLVSLYKCGKCLNLPGGGQGLAGLMAQGLIKKWFENCRQLWIQCGLQWDEPLFTLAEDFLNALMAIHEACKEGTYKITESFLYPVGQLAVDPRIYTLIQKEAIRKFNLILDKVPVELKKDKKLLTSQDASDIMIKLAGQIMEGGDYDLQSSLMEALCRMATPDQRKKQADRWFSMGHVATAFAKIRDSEFETACRSFLNMVNGMQGDRRRVYSYPCLEVYLDKYELLMPTDEKLEEFWIDFNLSSRSISFYFSLVDEEAQEGHWETISINENEVQSYTVTEEGKRKILQIKMSEVVVVGAVEGSCLTIRFSSSLDILQAARNIYGHNKSKGTSVVKTTAKTVVAENCTQVVPESQVSPGEGERSTAPYHLPAPAAPVQMVTPAKKRISESTTFISSSSGVVHKSRSLAVMQSRTPATAKDKASLEMVHSCDATVKACSDSATLGSTKAAGMKEQSAAAKQVIKKKVDKHKKDIPVAEAVHMVLSGEEKKSQDHNFVPDTQPSSGGNTSSCWSKFSVSEMMVMPTQKISSLPRPAPRSSIAGQQESRQSSAKKWSVSDSSICQKQLHIELTERLQQVLSERNQDPAPQEPAASQREMSDIRRGSKDRSTGDQSVLSLCTPNVQQALRHAKGKRKGQTLMGENAVPVKASGKISTTKSLQEMKPPNVKVETKRTLSHKEKRDAEVTGSMVKLISSHYEMSTCSTEKRNTANTPRNWIPPLVNRPVFNMSWQSTGKRQISGAVCQIEAHIKTTTKSIRKRGDIFAFNIDAPMSIGGSNKTFTNTSAILSSGIDSSSVLISTTKTDQPAAKNKRYVKKHLFSDTDTDNAMTEVSWLRESNRKAKPKIYEYSRQAPIQPKAVPPHTSYESPDFFPLSAKAVMANDKPSKKKPYLKKAVGQPKKTAAAAPSRPHAAGKRPKRAAAISAKNYRVPDTDDSQSEPEKLPTPKYTVTDYLENTEEKMKQKKTFSKQTTKSSKKLESKSVSEKPRTSKGKSVKPFLEVPKVKRKNTFAEQSTDNYRTRDSNIQSDTKKPSGLKQKRPENVLQDTSTLNKKSVTTAQEQMSALKDSWAACQTSFCPSPPFMETMRSAERSAPTLSSTLSPLLTPRGSPLPASPDPPCQDTPLPILLLPKPRSTVSSKGNCKPSTFYSAEKKRISSKTRSIRSVPSLPLLRGQTPPPSPLNGPSAAEQHLSSAKSASSLSTRPLLTSTFLELDKPPVPSPQSPFPEDTINHSRHSVSSKVSSVSRVSFSQSSTKSSVLSRRVKDSRSASLAGSCTTEKSPLPDRDLTLEQRHVSGPRRKRHISLSSNSEADEKEERKKSKMRRQRSPRMKPRKLFKSSSRTHGQAHCWGKKSSLKEEDNKESRPKDRTFKITKKISEENKNAKNKTVKDTSHGAVAEASALEELSQVMSSSRMSSSHWEAEVVDGDMDRDEDLELREMTVNPNNLGQHMSSELHKKFQNRSKIIEVYNKQSLKTMQQHVSSINVQVTKNRTEMIEKVKEVLLEEIHKLEQGDTVLKSMEKDFTIHWKKQTIAFHSYQKQETRRNETLKRALQSNMCHSVEFEERIFTSQMGLIRKDMKSVQDRLLSEMQEGEIQSVKRGLHALFFP